ncbi:MAG: DUF202 domain-containing protein [Flavobacteriales bacterium]|nr:DUF202 domain-containing protein [Flavobacteriales bacterium]
MDSNKTFDKSREHQANERTFLSWVRTSIALMGLGFVIVKFSLFAGDFSALIESHNTSTKSFSKIVGITMIILGVLISFFSFVQYKIHEKELFENRFKPNNFLLFFITLVLLVGGSILVVFLIQNV